MIIAWAILADIAADIAVFILLLCLWCWYGSPGT